MGTFDTLVEKLLNKLDIKSASSLEFIPPKKFRSSPKRVGIGSIFVSKNGKNDRSVFRLLELDCEEMLYIHST